MKQKLIDCFPDMNRQVISIIGSGGKTSLMWYLAKNSDEKKVLITTSTKIGIPKRSADYHLFLDNFSCLGNSEKRVEIAGIPIIDQQKLAMPPQKELVVSFPRFETVFIEADGSKQRPLKAWADFEPVILPQTTLTIGILPLSVLGKQINKHTVHRLERFLSTFSVEAGQLITPDVLAEISIHPEGLFSKATGEKVLFLNQNDQVQNIEVYQTLLSALPISFLDHLDRVIVGSIFQERGQVLWE